MEVHLGPGDSQHRLGRMIHTLARRLATQRQTTGTDLRQAKPNQSGRAPVPLCSNLSLAAAAIDYYARCTSWPEGLSGCYAPESSPWVAMPKGDPLNPQVAAPRGDPQPGPQVATPVGVS
eukprot:5655260-Amphidinium_carterae.1